MRPVWMPVMFAIALGCLTVGCQGNPAEEGSAEITRTSDAADNRTITVTGCLQHSRDVATDATGTSGSAGTRSDGASRPSAGAEWILANATTSSDGGTAAHGASASAAHGSSAGQSDPSSSTRAAGSAGTASGNDTRTSGMNSGDRYILEPGSEDLTAQNGHRVEVTGTLAPSLMSGPGSGSGASGDTTASSGSGASGNRAGGPSAGELADGRASGGRATGSDAAMPTSGTQRILVTSVRTIAQNCQ
jgi:hypothetical protein